MSEEIKYKILKTILIVLYILLAVSITTALVGIGIQIYNIYTPDPPKPEPTLEQLQRAEDFREVLRGTVSDLRGR